MKQYKDSDWETLDIAPWEPHARQILLSRLGQTAKCFMFWQKGIM